MIINTAGEYTLQYTATDACGNSTTVERELTVIAQPKTVLYSDGTLVINDLTSGEEHGTPSYEYPPFDPNGATDADKYIFSSASDRPWDAQKYNISYVEIGSPIQPTSTAHWFENLSNATDFDGTNLDTSNVTNMSRMFGGSKFNNTFDISGFDTANVIDMSYMFYNIRFKDIDVSNFDTSNVENMTNMFATSSDPNSQDYAIDLSGFNTSKVTNMSSMFYGRTYLKTIYASSNFIVDQVTSSTNMFFGTSNLVGGAGTVWSSSYRTKTYARIDNPPDAPGYFTARS